MPVRRRPGLLGEASIRRWTRRYRAEASLPHWIRERRRSGWTPARAGETTSPRGRRELRNDRGREELLVSPRGSALPGPRAPTGDERPNLCLRRCATRSSLVKTGVSPVAAVCWWGRCTQAVRGIQKDGGHPDPRQESFQLIPDASEPPGPASTGEGMTQALNKRLDTLASST